MPRLHSRDAPRETSGNSDDSHHINCYSLLDMPYAMFVVYSNYILYTRYLYDDDNDN